MFQYWHRHHGSHTPTDSSDKGWLRTELFEHDFQRKHRFSTSNKQLGVGGVIKSCADLLSHGIHEILPLVLSPTEMPVHVELPTASSSTGTCNREELSLLGKEGNRCLQITTAGCWGMGHRKGHCQMKIYQQHTERVTILNPAYNQKPEWAANPHTFGSLQVLQLPPWRAHS